MEGQPYLLIAFLTGEATDVEISALARWRSADPGAAEMVRRQERMWYLVGQLATNPRVREPVQIDPAHWRRTPAGTGMACNVPVRSARFLVPAAALIVGISLGLTRANPSNAELGAEDVVTGDSEFTTLTLRDGTVVRLGPGSRLGFRAAEGPRDVFLEGRAYFAVPSGKKDPFRVHTAAGELTVVGTRFDVKAQGPQLDVLVVEGEVVVGSEHDRVNVGASERARVKGAGEPVVEAVEDVFEATAWVGAFIAYESTPVREAVLELSDRFGIRVEILDAEVADRTVSGWFRDQSPLEILANVCDAVDARCSTADGVVQISAARTPSLPNQ